MSEQSRIRTIYYWITLLLFLVIVDDGLFGPVFWALSQFNLPLSIVTAFTCSWLLSYWLTLQGMKPVHGWLARTLLRNLRLEQSKDSERERRVQRLREKTTSISIAIPMTLLFGGVIVTLWLLRRGVITPHRARFVALGLTALYAVIFAAVHALGIGGSILFAHQ